MSPHCFIQIGRISFSYSSIWIWFKLFRFYHTSWTLGPKLHAVVDMVPELVVAMYLIVVFMCAYAVALQSLLDPYRVLERWWQIFSVAWEGLSLAYFQMYGELQLER